jgi:hypothetical protein
MNLFISIFINYMNVFIFIDVSWLSSLGLFYHLHQHMLCSYATAIAYIPNIHKSPIFVIIFMLALS